MRRDAWVGEADMGRQIAEVPFRMPLWLVMLLFGLSAMFVMGLFPMVVEPLVLDLDLVLYLAVCVFMAALSCVHGVMGLVNRQRQLRVQIFEKGLVIPRRFRRPVEVTLPLKFKFWVVRGNTTLLIRYGWDDQRVGLGKLRAALNKPQVSRADFKTIVDHLRVLEERSEVLLRDRAVRFDFLRQAIDRHVTKMEAGLLDPNDLDWGDPEWEEIVASLEGYALEEIAAWSDEQWNAMMRGERPSEATPEATDAVLRLGGA